MYYCSSVLGTAKLFCWSRICRYEIVAGRVLLVSKLVYLLFSCLILAPLPPINPHQIFKTAAVMENAAYVPAVRNRLP